MGQDGQAPGSARLQLAGGAPLLRPGGAGVRRDAGGLAGPAAGPQPGVLDHREAAGGGRGRSPGTRTRSRGRGPRRCSMSGSVTCGRSRGLRRSTIRNYALAVSAFCRYLTDPAYGWAARVPGAVRHPPGAGRAMSGTPRCTSRQAEGDPGKRAFTVDELQAFFDHADEQVGEVRGRGRKGWLPAFRDAALFKVAYGFGLRRTEAADARPGRLRHQPARCASSASYGLCRVRFGKASQGLTAETAQRADRLAVAARRPGPVDRGGPAR